jgi:hypothetical protein
MMSSGWLQGMEWLLPKSKEEKTKLKEERSKRFDKIVEESKKRTAKWKKKEFEDIRKLAKSMEFLS